MLAGLALVVSVGVVGATALRRRGVGETHLTAGAVVDSSPSQIAVAMVQRDSSVGEEPAAQPISRVAEGRSAAPPLAPIVNDGETEIGGGMTAQRTNGTVTLHFDTELGRTRRPEKFESLVRSTLPKLYGRGVDSLLAALPEGAVAGQGDLITELPSRGFRIVLEGGWTLAVFPETRPGRDGPLVVSYRAIVTQ
jgi:hypothetical protein